MPLTIDLNADLGEGVGDDDALLEVVTTASVAAGAHAGGGQVLAEVVRRAVARRVAVGAHPSYPDRLAFGRVSMADRLDTEVLSGLVCEQVLAVADECTRNGHALAHVKTHGALYNDAAVGERIAGAVLAGVHRAAGRLGVGDLPIMALPGSVQHRMVAEAGAPFLAEAFADRAYSPDGSLMPRGLPGSVLTDPDAICRQAVDIAVSSSVTCADGSRIDVRADTICLHGDTPGAVGLARAVRAALEAAGVRVTAPVRRP
ncbi:MAG: LamB/YcsF family protein [Actinobacteria bacterium]|nr:LamB/YcsF family protein [Actinomycetota bacterium]